MHRLPDLHDARSTRSLAVTGHGTSHRSHEPGGSAMREIARQHGYV